MSEMKRGFDFPYKYQGNMLKDQHRLAMFKKAIEQVLQGDEGVLDAGTGSGILAAYAAEKTQGPVCGVDIDDACIRIAKKIHEASGNTDIDFILGDAAKVDLAFQPDVLVTETIGQVGPEEGTVELCYEIMQRFPSIKTLVPSRLEIWIEPVSSTVLSIAQEKIIEMFVQASNSKLDFSVIKPELLDAISQEVEQADLSRAVQKYAEGVCLVSYELGKTKSSAFESIVDVSKWKQAAQALHIYFRAVLVDGIELSNHYSDPMSHWGHNFIYLHKDLPDQLCVFFNPSPSWEEQEKIQLKWLEQ